MSHGSVCERGRTQITLPQDPSNHFERARRLPKPHELSRHVEHRFGIWKFRMQYSVASMLSACLPSSSKRSEPMKFSHQFRPLDSLHLPQVLDRLVCPADRREDHGLEIEASSGAPSSARVASPRSQWVWRTLVAIAGSRRTARSCAASEADSRPQYPARMNEAGPEARAPGRWPAPR